MAEVIQEFKAPDGVETATFRNIIEAAYTAWVSNRRELLPTADDVKEYSQHQKATIAKVMDTREFMDAMIRRGVPWAEDGSISQGLTTRQMLLLNILTNPGDRRTQDKKLKSAGVSATELRAWQKTPAWKKAIAGISDGILTDNIAQIKTAVVEKATSGDLNAAKLVFEMTGEHDPATKQTQDLKAILGLLLEVLTMHIKDPEVLELVSRDIVDKVAPVITGQVVRRIEG